MSIKLTPKARALREELAAQYLGNMREYKRYRCIEDDYKAGYGAGYEVRNEEAKVLVEGLETVACESSIQWGEFLGKLLLKFNDKYQKEKS